MSETRSGGAVIASVASLASLISALSCCLPLGTLLMAAGSAGASLFSEKLRPWLLALSVSSLAFAFVQTYWRRRCEFRERRFRTLLLWFSIVVVAGMLVMPRLVASLLGGRLPAFSATSQLRTFEEAVFAREFNAASDRFRLVILLSPT